MSLPKKDLRLKLDADFHALLCAAAKVHRMLPAEYAKRLLTEEFNSRVREATLLSDAVRGLGFAGKPGDRRGR